MVSPQRYEYRIRVADANALGRVGLVALMDLMQDAAWRHTAELGASVAQLKAHGIGWALSRLRLEMQQYPALGDSFWVETWASGGARSLVYRDFRLWDAQGRCIGQATSTWMIFDLQARRLSSLPDDLQALVPTAYPPALPRANGRWSAPAWDAQAPRHSVDWHHLDVNQHVNHSQYLRWSLADLPLAKRQGAQIQTVEVVWRRECRQGDHVRSSLEQLDANHFSHGLYRDEDQQLLMSLQSQWSSDS
jgi:acyl-ACP thioesterase